jgi:hypothetical protein
MGMVGLAPPAPSKGSRTLFLSSDNELHRQIRSGGMLDKVKVRTDAQIIAVAIAQGAEKVITHDDHFKTLAKGKIAIEEVPIIREQLKINFDVKS